MFRLGEEVINTRLCVYDYCLINIQITSLLKGVGDRMQKKCNGLIL